MPATSWEDKQNRFSRLWKWLFILLPLLIVAGIIINNNRDFIFGKGIPEKEKKSLDVSSSGVHGLPPVAPVPKGAEGAVVKSLPRPAQFPKANSSEHGSTEAKKRQELPMRDSLLMEDVRCRALDRGDLRIHLAIMLYYKDTRRRNDILIKRDALAVMARKVIGEMELEAIKIDKITPLIFRAMGAIFDNNPLSDIVIKSITIEKVFQK